MKNTSIFSRGLTNLKQTYQKIRERTKILVTRRPRVISTFFQKRRLITSKQRQLLELAIEFQRKFPYAGERPTFGEMSLIGRQKFMFGATKLLIRNKKIRKALLEMAEIKQNKKTDEEIENKLINELLQETKSIDEVIKLIQSEQKHISQYLIKANDKLIQYLNLLPQMRNITTKRKEATEKKSKTELAKELANNAMKRTRTRWEALELLHKIEEHLMSLVWKQKKYFEESQLRALEEIKNKPKALKQFEKIYAQANQMIENPIKILLAEIYSAKLAIWDTIEVPRYEKRK